MPDISTYLYDSQQCADGIRSFRGSNPADIGPVEERRFGMETVLSYTYKEGNEAVVVIGFKRSEPYKHLCGVMAVDYVPVLTAYWAPIRVMFGHSNVNFRTK